jgi:hypothetical protein
VTDASPTPRRRLATDIVVSLAEELRAKGIWLGLARVEGGVLGLWHRAGAIDAVGAENVFADVKSAVESGRKAQRQPRS